MKLNTTYISKDSETIVAGKGETLGRLVDKHISDYIKRQQGDHREPNYKLSKIEIEFEQNDIDKLLENCR